MTLLKISFRKVTVQKVPSAYKYAEYVINMHTESQCTNSVTFVYRNMCGQN